MKTYTFHVSLPGYGRVWRKLELPAENTLADLHLAIQDAFDFDNDHLFSFFMSGKAWDQSTEYSLPEGATPWDLDMELGEDEDDELELLEDDDELDEEPIAPTAQDFRMIVAAMQNDESAREKLLDAMKTEFGVPAFLAESFVDNLTQMVNSSSDEQLNELLTFPLNDDDERLAGDVRTTTIESLGLKKNKTFLYLFDYGDEWRFKVKVDAINNKADESAEYPRVVEAVGDPPPQYGDEDDDEEWDEEEASDE